MNLCVLASGKGSDLRAIYKAAKLRLIKSRIRIVISNNSKSGALKFSKQNNIPHYHLSQKLFNTESEFINEFLKLMKKYNIEMIVLAGYMKLLSPVIIRKYRNKIINVHPALLPAFGGKGMYGMNVHKAIVENKEKETGITIHFVNENYDEGNIIFQKKVTVLITDTPEVVAEKIHELEQQYFPSIVEEVLNSKS